MEINCDSALDKADLYKFEILFQVVLSRQLKYSRQLVLVSEIMYRCFTDGINALYNRLLLFYILPKMCG